MPKFASKLNPPDVLPGDVLDADSAKTILDYLRALPQKPKAVAYALADEDYRATGVCLNLVSETKIEKYRTTLNDLLREQFPITVARAEPIGDKTLYPKFVAQTNVQDVRGLRRIAATSTARALKTIGGDSTYWVLVWNDSTNAPSGDRSDRRRTPGKVLHVVLSHHLSTNQLDGFRKYLHDLYKKDVYTETEKKAAVRGDEFIDRVRVSDAFVGKLGQPEDESLAWFCQGARVPCYLVGKRGAKSDAPVGGPGLPISHHYELDDLFTERSENGPATVSKELVAVYSELRDITARLKQHESSRHVRAAATRWVHKAQDTLKSVVTKSSLIDLSVSHQFLDNVSDCFYTSNDLTCVSLCRVSTFWEDDAQKKQIDGYLQKHPPNTIRLFVPDSAQRLRNYTRTLDAHYRQYGETGGAVLVCSEPTYRAYVNGLLDRVSPESGRTRRERQAVATLANEFTAADFAVLENGGPMVAEFSQTRLQFRSLNELQKSDPLRAAFYTAHFETLRGLLPDIHDGKTESGDRRGASPARLARLAPLEVYAWREDRAERIVNALFPPDEAFELTPVIHVLRLIHPQEEERQRHFKELARAVRDLDETMKLTREHGIESWSLIRPCDLAAFRQLVSSQTDEGVKATTTESARGWLEQIEQMYHSGPEYQLVMRFRSAQALRAYQQHPEHVKVRRRFYEAIHPPIAADYKRLDDAEDREAGGDEIKKIVESIEGMMQRFVQRFWYRVVIPSVGA